MWRSLRHAVVLASLDLLRMATQVLLQEGPDRVQRSLRRVERPDHGGKNVRHPLPDVRRRLDPLAAGARDVAARIVQEDLARADMELDRRQAREVALERRGERIARIMAV